MKTLRSREHFLTALITLSCLMAFLSSCRLPSQYEKKYRETIEAEGFIASSIAETQTLAMSLMQQTETASAQETSAAYQPTEIICNASNAWCETPGPTPTLSDKHFHGSLYYEVPHQDQFDLYVNSAKTDAGCVAASLQMVASFWHRFNQNYPEVSAQDIIDKNVVQQVFNFNDGMNFSSARDEMQAAGYFLGIRINSNKEELLEALERFGPLLIQTKTEWVWHGQNHVSVLTAYDRQRDSVTINDPWLGKPVEWTWQEFDGIWGLNYAETPNRTPEMRRIFCFIIPKEEVRPYGDFLISAQEYVERINPGYVTDTDDSFP